MMPQNLSAGTSTFAETITILGQTPMPMDPGAAASIGLIALFSVIVINGILLAVWGIRRLFQERATFQRRWSWLDLWLVPQIIAHLFAVLLVPLMFLAMPNAKDAEEMMANVGFILPMLFIQNIVFFGVPAAFVWLKYQLPLREIGLPPLPKRRDVLLGIGLGLLAVPTFSLMEIGLRMVAEHYKEVPFIAWGLNIEKNLPINALIEAITKQGIGVLLLAALAIGPGPGFGEEMLFRGFLFGLLKRRIGLWPGVIISGFVFAAVHGYFIAFLPVFLFGMALAALYHKTGSLWTGIIVHATNNSVLVLLAYFFPSLIH